MNLEKNPKTRAIAKQLLSLEDVLEGRPFPGMARVNEISNYSCGPATLEMLLSYVQVKKSQTALIRSIRVAKKIRLYGINVAEMAKAATAANKGKLSFWRKQKATINDIETTINKFKYPVGVEWQGDFYEREDEDKGHYSVITKINKKRGFIRLSDPYFNSFYNYNGLDRKYSVPEFYKKWWDVNEVSVNGTTKRRKIKDIRIMFVITPKSETWPRKLGMVKQ